MAKRPTLLERLIPRLQRLGVTERKSKELAKGLAQFKKPTKGTVAEKLQIKLVKLGLSERKAKELAKKLVPTVNAALAAKAAAKVTPDLPLSKVMSKTVTEVIDGVDDAELDKVAPRVNGHRLRLDLPVVAVGGMKGIELLRVVHGLTTHATYIVAAVNSDDKFIAVRRFSGDYFNVKFYPHMSAWSKTVEELQSLGAEAHLLRPNLYERMHFHKAGLDQLLQRLEAEAKPRSRMKALKDRFIAITVRPLVQAFDILYSRGVQHRAS